VAAATPQAVAITSVVARPMTGDEVVVSTTGCDRSWKDPSIWKSSRKKRIDVAPITHDQHFRHIAARSNSTFGVAAFLASEKSGIISLANLRRLSLEPPAPLTSTYSTPTASSFFSLSAISSGVPNKAFVLGGWLTEDYTWRYVFYINGPLGIIGVLGMMMFLPESPRSRQQQKMWSAARDEPVALPDRLFTYHC
jgi:hypothetical protein